MGRSTILVAALCALALVSCDDGGTDPPSCADVTSLDVNVGVGTSIVFDWDPACPLVLLLVEEGASDRWSIRDPGMDANTIEPPVTYGVVPAGATATMEAAELQAGVTHDVVLWRVDPATGAGRLLAVVEFVP